MRAKVLTLVLVCLYLSSCATVFKGTSEEVNFNSNPIGAEVWIDGKNMGKTPVKFKLTSKKTYMIEFKFEGYETKTVSLTNHVGAGWVILDVLAGLVGVIVDAATGAWYSFDEKNVNVTLAEGKISKN